MLGVNAANEGSMPWVSVCVSALQEHCSSYSPLSPRMPRAPGKHLHYPSAKAPYGVDASIDIPNFLHLTAVSSGVSSFVAQLTDTATIVFHAVQN